MICKGCGESFDEKLFPVCPYCLLPNSVEENDTSIENQEIDDAIVEIGDIPEEKVESVEEKEIEDEKLFEDETFLSFKEDDSESDKLSESDEDGTNSECCVDKDINIFDVSEFSMRTKYILHRNRIFNLFDLKKVINENCLDSIRGLRRVSKDEIKRAISKNHKQRFNIASENNDSSRDEKISDVYAANKYKLFVSYCERNGMVYMNDFKDFDFMTLLDIQGIGKGKLDDIIGIFNSYYNGEINVVEQTQFNIVTPATLFGYINEQLLDLNISFLLGLGIKQKQIDELSLNGYNRISDLQNISVNSLQQIVGIRYVEKFRAIEGVLKDTIIEIFGSVLSEYENEEDFIIDVKKAEGCTLQELGEEYGVTRERIRQKISKFNNRLNAFMNPIIDFFMYPKEYVKTQELLDIYDNDNFDKVLIYWCKNCKSLEYMGFADAFVQKREDDKSIYDEILKIANEFIGDRINLYDNLEELETLMQEANYPYVDGGAFLNLAQENGYKVYGDFVVKGRQSYAFLCAKIVAKKFPNGIKLYEGSDLNLLRRYALEEYGDLGIPGNDRAFSSRLSDYLILSDRGSVTAESNIHIEMSVLDEIKEFIDTAEEGEIYYAEIFSRFEGMLRMMSNIDNYNFLHGVLKLYFSDDYYFSNRDLLKKRGEGYTSGKLSTKIKCCIEEAGKPVHRNDIKKKVPGLTNIVLLSAISSDQDLFQWDYNYFYSTTLMNISENDMSYLCNQIEIIMNKNNGYCSDNMLIDEVKRFRRDFLIVNHIEASNNLYYLCQTLFSDKYEFRRPHISRKGLLEEISVKNVALHLMNYPELLSYTEYQGITEHLKWSPVTIGMVFCDIEQDYIRITDDLYLKSVKFTISDEAIIQITNVLLENMNNDYISLINFDYWDLLPEIGYEWNIYLLRSIIDRYVNELRIVEIRAKDRRYERGIVIKKESKIADYTDFVIRFLELMGYNEISEGNLLTLLVMNNLTYKMIPKELYSSEKIKYENECFRIM